jgi:replicative DNA helicase
MPKLPVCEVPFNEHAERTILGAILTDDEYLSQLAILLPEDFMLDAHQHIYRTMMDMREDGQGIDLVTLPERLGDMAKVGGRAYLCSLTEGLPLRPAIRDYVRIVKGKALARRLIAACEAAIESAYAGLPGRATIALLKDNLEAIEAEAKIKPSD